MRNHRNNYFGFTMVFINAIWKLFALKNDSPKYMLLIYIHLKIATIYLNCDKMYGQISVSEYLTPELIVQTFWTVITLILLNCCEQKATNFMRRSQLHMLKFSRSSLSEKHIFYQHLILPKPAKTRRSVSISQIISKKKFSKWLQKNYLYLI